MSRRTLPCGIAAATLAAGLLVATGCVRRTIEITSTPSGALVLLNDREIGRTPTSVEIDHYGTYDVQLRLEGREPLDTAAKAVPPPWDWVGPDLVAELLPGTFVSRNRWHFELVPWDREPDAVLERARVLRLRVEGDPALAAAALGESLGTLETEVEADDALPGERPSPATTDVPMPGPETAPSSPLPSGPTRESSRVRDVAG